MSPPSFAEAVADDLETLRARAPLVHNITNFVVMNLTANMLLALGASPVMAHAPEEVEEMVGLADALVHDTSDAVRDGISRFLGKSSAVSLAAVKARQKELAKRLKKFGAATDPDAVWKGMGVRNIQAASLASGPEFVALAKRGK